MISRIIDVLRLDVNFSMVDILPKALVFSMNYIFSYVSITYYPLISFYQGQVDIVHFSQLVRPNLKLFYSTNSTNKVSRFALFNTVLYFISVEYVIDCFINSCQTFCSND